MAFRLPAKREVFAYFCLGLWFYGMCRLDIYTSDAYLRTRFCLLMNYLDFSRYRCLCIMARFVTRQKQRG